MGLEESCQEIIKYAKKEEKPCLTCLKPIFLLILGTPEPSLFMVVVIFFFLNSIDEKYINQKLGPGDVYVRIVYSYQGFHLHLKFFHHKKDVLHSELNVQKFLF